MAKKTTIDRIADAYQQNDLGSVQAALSRPGLTPLVRSALHNLSVEVEDWQCQPLKKGGGGGQLFKVSGTASEGERYHDWSLVLKILRKETSTQGLSEDDWQREALAYRSGLLDAIPGGLEAATCYALEDRSEGEIWMWLEDLSGVPDAPWSLERYALAARHLGQLNGYYLHHPLPEHPWLVRAFERQAMQRDGNIENYRQHKDHPLVRKLVPAEKEALIFGLWDRREEIFEKLFEHLPQTFGHMDAFRANLFSRPNSAEEPPTVAIDWAFTGINPVGTELKILVSHSLNTFTVDLNQIEDLDQQAFDGYMDGLRDAGWEGDPRQVRYAYTMIGASSLIRGLSFLGILTDESKHGLLEEMFGRSFDEIIDTTAQYFYPFFFGLAQEGLVLDKELF